ncbi:MAG TPA: HEPN domain-containing protein [Nitrospirae bacterium]|nr:HEPN domain-containing protein [Nitrospirota bacterium]
MVERLSRKEARLLAEQELQRAIEEIKSAEILKEHGIHFKSVVSSYYSVFHAAKAALLLKGVTPRSHEGVERMFSLYYVRSGTIDVDISRIIGRLMKLREEADYFPESPFTEKDSADALKMAKHFFTKIKPLFQKSRSKK